jgi:hypothetical protein
LLQAIWNEQAQKEAGVSFVSGQVVVSVKGGQVVTGGAPLDLILGKVHIVENLFYRTAEFLKSVPLREKRSSIQRDSRAMPALAFSKRSR